MELAAKQRMPNKQTATVCVYSCAALHYGRFIPSAVEQTLIDRPQHNELNSKLQILL
jgi:hypothetical protein